MKKEYIEPTIDVITLRTMGMLAASLTKDDSEENAVKNEDEVLSIKIFDDDNEDW
jgi:hypothetical protein